MFSKIVVPFDGSKQARAAFACALAIAEKFAAEIVVISVARPPEPATRVELDAVIDSATQHFEEEFVALRAEAASKGVNLRTEVDVGHPAAQILFATEREHADLIVMGRRGKTLIERWMLGSVSERVVRYAHCPVLVVH